MILYVVHGNTYYNDCRDIWEKLRDAGIEMRPVFWSNEDKKNYKKAALLD